MLITQINPHGGDVWSHPGALDFSANINPFGMPEAVKRALSESIGAAVCYPDPRCTALTKAFAEKLRIDPDRLLFGNGAAELIYHFAACLPRGLKARILEPAFQEYESALNAACIPADHLFLTEENGFRPDGSLLAADPSDISALFVCSPNNPTGGMLPPGLLRALAGRYPLVFCDLSFLDLSGRSGCYDIPALVREYPQIVFLFSFTKSYAIPGLRLGCAVCGSRSLLEQMAEKAPAWNVSVPAQAAGLAALDCGDWLKASVLSIRRERDRMAARLRELGFAVFESEANFLLFKSALPLDELLLEKNILIRNCRNFRGLGPGYYRTAVRTEAENDRLLTALKEVLP